MPSSLFQDLRVGARNLLASPRFALVASLTLALGVGVNGAAFSLVNGAMLNVVPWEADGVVMISSQNLAEKLETPVSGARYRDWREQSQSFRNLLAVRFLPFVLTDREPSEAVPGVEVSAETFEALGLRLALGRGFGAADAEPDAPQQVVLTHALWSERFGSAPDLVGRTIEIEAQAVLVAGVLAEGQWYPSPNVQLLAPLRPSALQGPRDRGLFTLAVSLASVGLYGVVSYSVAQRMPELAIRSALGAEPAQIVRLVLRGAMWISGIGIALGLVLSILVSLALKMAQILSRNVDPTNPGVFSAAALLLGAIILGASAIPAYRSSRAEPSHALRAQ